VILKSRTLSRTSDTTETRNPCVIKVIWQFILSFFISNRLYSFLKINILSFLKTYIISFIFTTERVFYNSHLYSLYIGSLLQLCSFCFTANVLKNKMDNSYNFKDGVYFFYHLKDNLFLLFQHYIYSNVLRIFYL
jgi:hypothetical protein